MVREWGSERVAEPRSGNRRVGAVTSSRMMRTRRVSGSWESPFDNHLASPGPLACHVGSASMRGQHSDCLTIRDGGSARRGCCTIHSVGLWRCPIRHSELAPRFATRRTRVSGAADTAAHGALRSCGALRRSQARSAKRGISAARRRLRFAPSGLCNSLRRPTPTAVSVDRRGRVPSRPVPSQLRDGFRAVPLAMTHPRAVTRQHTRQRASSLRPRLRVRRCTPPPGVSAATLTLFSRRSPRHAAPRTPPTPRTGCGGTPLRIPRRSACRPPAPPRAETSQSTP